MILKTRQDVRIFRRYLEKGRAAGHGRSQLACPGFYCFPLCLQLSHACSHHRNWVRGADASLPQKFRSLSVFSSHISGLAFKTHNAYWWDSTLNCCQLRSALWKPHATTQSLGKQNLAYCYKIKVWLSADCFHTNQPSPPLLLPIANLACSVQLQPDQCDFKILILLIVQQYSNVALRVSIYFIKIWVLLCTWKYRHNGAKWLVPCTHSEVWTLSLTILS